MKADKALGIIAVQCSRREYCSSDILAKLRRWEVEESETGRIMEFLIRNKFVDDSRFARIYAEDKSRFNRWGKRKIALMLRQKSISDDIIADVLSSLEDESCRNGCLEIMRQKAAGLPELPLPQFKARLIRFALGRGFDYDCIASCLEELLASD